MENIAYPELIEDSMHQNEKLNKMRSKLHVEALKIMQQLKMLEKDEPRFGSNLEQRGLLQLLNYLVVDYFDWYGYTNTLKTFSIETGEKSRPKPREKLQRELGNNFDNIELPMLLQMLIKETGNDNKMLLDNASWQHFPKNTNKLKKSTGIKVTSADEKQSNKLKKHKSNVALKNIKAEKPISKQVLTVDKKTSKRLLKPRVPIVPVNDIIKPLTKVRQSMAEKGTLAAHSGGQKL